MYAQPEPVSPSRHESWKASAFSEFLTVIYRYRWLIVSTFLATFLSTAVWLFIRQDSYETTTKVLVRFSRESFNPRSESSSSVARMLPAPKPDLPTEIDLIGSYAIISQLVDRLHLDQPGPPKPAPTRIVPRIRYELRRASNWLNELGDEIQYSLAVKERLALREKAIVEVSESLSVETSKDSSVMSIKLKTKFKEGASVILNTLVEIYSEQRMKVELNPGKMEFLDRALNRQWEKLRSEEGSLEALRRKAEIYGSLPEQIDLANRRVLEADNQYRLTETLLGSLRAKAATLKTQLGEQKPTRVVSQISQRNSLVDTLNERRSALVLEKQKLLGKFSDDHVSIRDIDNQIAQAEKLIAATLETVRQSETTSLNQNFAELEKNLFEVQQSIAAAESQLSSQAGTLKELKEKREALLASDSEYRGLVRSIAADEEAYRLQRRNTEEFRTAEAMSNNGITQIAVVDKAVDPIVPKGFRKVYLLGGGFAAGLLLAFGLAFVCNGIDGAINGPSQLAEVLNRAPLAVLPESPAGPKGMPEGEEFLARAISVLSEIDQLQKQHRPAVVAFGGVGQGAGVSTIARMAAEVMGQAGALKIELFRFQADPSLPALGTVTPTGASSSGVAIVDASAPVLATAGMIEEQVRRFVASSTADLIILDVEAALPAAQQLGAFRASQSTLLVAESGRTQRSGLLRLMASFADAGVVAGGVILNKQKRIWGQLP